MILGHTIEDCYVFKDWVERKYRNGEIELPKSLLQDPAPHEQVNMISHVEFIPDSDEHQEDSLESWTLCVSKRTQKLIKDLQKEPKIYWEDKMTPIVPKKAIVVYQGTSSPKSKKKRKNNRKEKESAKATETYVQNTPAPLCLAGFIQKELKRVSSKEEAEPSSRKKEVEEIWGASSHSITH